MNGRTRERGFALVMTMILAVIVMGAVAALIVLVQNTAQDTTTQEQYVQAMDVAEVGFNQFLKDARVEVAWDDQLEEFVALVGANPDVEGGDTRTLAGVSDGINYQVQIRSAYWAYKNDPNLTGFLREVTAEERNTLSEPIFDLYQVTAKSGEVGRHEFQRAMEAVVEMRKDPIRVPAALYVPDGDHDFGGNDWRISGEDHDKDPKNLYPDYSLKMPVEGMLKVVFVMSEAGLDSSLWMIDPATGTETLTLPSNHPYNEDDRTSYTEVFAQNQELVFFGRVDAVPWGRGTYDHYLVGQYDPWYRQNNTNPNGGPYNGGTPKPERMPYGCISLYKLKDSVDLSGMSGGTLEEALSDNGNYELLQDENGVDYYKRYDITCDDLDNAEIRRLRYGMEDLKGNTWVDWDHDDIVADVYVLPAQEGSGETSATNYVVEHDEDYTIKYEDAPVGLGEDGALQTDVFVIEVEDGDGTLVSETKAGTGTAQLALNNPGDSFTDDLGFTVTFISVEDGVYTLHVTSDESESTAALSHVTFMFPEDATVTAPGGNNYSAVRITGNVNNTGGQSELYHYVTRPNEDDYLTGHNEYALPAVASEGEFCDLQPSGWSAGIFVTVDAAGNQIVGQNSFVQDSLNVEAMAQAYLNGTATVNEVGALATGTDLGAYDDYKVTHVTGSTTIVGNDILTGGGVLVVDGDLTIYGGLDFTGMVLVTGDLNIDPTAAGRHVFIRGSVMVAGDVDVDGKVDIWYSREAVDQTLQILGPRLQVVPVPRVWREVDPN